MTCWALIPFKGFDRGKSRLSSVLPPNERIALARRLFDHVVKVFRESPSVDGVAVVSSSLDALHHAETLGVVTLEDPPDSRGLFDVVDAGLAELERRGATSALICMSDLPELSVHDVESVVRQLEESDVVLVPDLLEEGTNLVAIRPPTAMPSCFGHEDSLRRHRGRARELGLTVSIQLSPGIGFDIDHPGDLERFRRR
jgi:2-phospho-L-lactate guanylyltransferase